MVGPASVRTPVLAIVNTADEVAPLASVVPFIEKMPVKDTKVCNGRPKFQNRQHLGFVEIAEGSYHIFSSCKLAIWALHGLALEHFPFHERCAQQASLCSRDLENRA